MNVLFLGQYRGPDNDGWSIAARRYLEALLLTGHNVACKPVYMGGGGGKVSKIIEQAENKIFDKIDVIIQNVLPDLFEKHEGHNIGIFFSETNNLIYTGWIEKINLLDELWVSCEKEKLELQKDGVIIPISVVPVPYKVPVYAPKKLAVPELDGKYVFYFIGEHNERKNIMALMQAFHREFSPHEDVSLLIKTNTDELKNEVNQWHEYSRTRKDYIPEVIITSQVDETMILDIHETCDCFVSPSRGEGFCLPVLDALYFNNRVLCTNGTYPNFIFHPYIGPIRSTTVPVNCKKPPLLNIYTGNETWKEIDILDLQRNMRDAYNEGKNKCESRQFISDNFSQQNISKKMKEVLECQ